MALIKLYGGEGEMFAELPRFINGPGALKIVSGILLSVVVAFSFGAVVQFISDRFLHFNSKETHLRKRHLRRRGHHIHYLFHTYQGIEKIRISQNRFFRVCQGTTRTVHCSHPSNLLHISLYSHNICKDQCLQNHHYRRNIRPSHGICRQ